MSAVVVVAVVTCAGLAAAPWAVGRRRLEPRGPGGRPGGRAGGRAVSRAVLGPVDAAVLLDLAGSALAAGTSVPGCLVAVGQSVGGGQGERLRRAGAALLLGASWAEAWRAGRGAGLGALEEALEPAWLDGVPAGPLVTRAADQVRAQRTRAAREAAARLGVRLVLPLGLCLLPAFVLLGLVPVLLSTGRGLLG